MRKQCVPGLFSDGGGEGPGNEARLNQHQHGSFSVSDPRWHWLCLTCETIVLILSLLGLYPCVNSSVSFHVVQATGCLFGKLASFHAIWEACKSLGQLSNCLGWFLNRTTYS